MAEAAQDRRRNEDLVQVHKETVRKATNSPRLQVKRIANLDDAEKRLARAKYKLDYCLDELESKIRIHSKEGL